MSNIPEFEKPNVPIGIVIFGVTGDLTRRKLFPALYHLALVGQLPEKLFIIGFARRDWDDDKLREEMKSSLDTFSRSKPIDEKVQEKLLGRLRYVSSSFEEPGGYKKLDRLLKELGADNRLFYLSSPPSSYSGIVKHLGEAGLSECGTGWTRVVIEKPYGHDLNSSQMLDEIVHNVFQENQVYRIDHYLGKETVQNILVFRFANGIFEPLWNHRYIDNVQISVAESGGIGSRAGYYDKAGVMRDMFQNHILQLLALTAMEAPVTFNADAVRDEKVKVIRALKPIEGDSILEKTFR
ncbi:MAG: glucose-6-phosphate dehydrogenase (NADP(+)), partial [Chloroflexota bacterium]